MAAKQKSYKIPFHPVSGDLEHYPQDVYQYKPDDPKANANGYICIETIWKDDYVFEATLTLTGSRRGRSAAYFEFTDDQGKRYPMFMRELEKMLKGASVEQGKVTGVWSFVKQGTNYSITWLGEMRKATQQKHP